MAIGWKLVGQATLNFLRVAWPILLIMAITLYGANHFYFGPKIDKLESDIKVVTNERDDARETVEEQNKAITNLSEIAAKITQEEIGELKDMLENMSEENRRVIESILEAGVPEGCEDSRQFLIDMIDQLQWEESNNG
jgi:hypothetical protein